MQRDYEYICVRSRVPIPRGLQTEKRHPPSGERSQNSFTVQNPRMDSRTQNEKDRANRKRIQHNPIPGAITMWFKRHPQVREDLAEEISEEEHSREAITETFFENGTFREIEGFRQWIMDLTTKGAKERTIHS